MDQDKAGLVQGERVATARPVVKGTERWVVAAMGRAAEGHARLPCVGGRRREGEAGDEPLKG